MVSMFGMSEIGSGALADPTVQRSDAILRMPARNSVPEEEDIDKLVKAIFDKAYKITKTRITNNGAAVDHVVEVLLEKETVTGDEFRTILSEFIDGEVDRRDRRNVPELVAA